MSSLFLYDFTQLQVVDGLEWKAPTAGGKWFEMDSSGPGPLYGLVLVLILIVAIVFFFLRD